jgi:hypothetical protein
MSNIQYTIVPTPTVELMRVIFEFTDSDISAFFRMWREAINNPTEQLRIEHSGDRDWKTLNVKEALS